MVVVGELPVVETTLIQRRRDGSRLNEDNRPYMPRLVVVDPVRLAVHAVSNEPSFPSTVLQLPGVGLFVHERPGPDHPKVSEVGIFPVERFVRRPVLQGCVRNPVCLLYTSPSPRDQRGSRMPSSA